MAANYAKRLPQDENNVPLDNYPPAFPALQVSSSENATTSSVINLTDSTTIIEVTAVGNAAAIKWIAQSNTNPSIITAAGTANYDNVIGSGNTRRFVVPRETLGVTSLVGIAVQAGLYRGVAIKSMGVGSVLTSQF